MSSLQHWDLGSKQEELPLLDLEDLLGEVVLYSLEVLVGGAHGDFHFNAANLVVVGIGRVALIVVEDGIGILRTEHMFYVQRCTKRWTCFAKRQPCRAKRKFTLVNP